MRRWALVPVILLLAAGCDFSHVNPQQTVVISGRALDAAGHPLANVEVHLYKEPDVGELIVGSVLAIGTLGGVCLLPGAPAVCHQGHTTTTGADGSYRFTIKGSDTQGLVGDASTLDAVFTEPKGGSRAASTTLRFKAQTKRVRLPTAWLWSARLRVHTSTGRRPAYETAWSGLPSRDGSHPSYSVQLLDPTHGLALWSQSAGGTRAQIDGRVLEDHTADAAVTAQTKLGDVDAVYLSARKPVHAIAGPPPSRNQPCSAVTGTRKLRSFKQTGCGATDGDLLSPARLTAASGKTVTGVEVDLGRPRRIALLVVRGAAGSVVLEVSNDGRSFRRVAVASGSTIAIAPSGRPLTRYVRVRSATGLSESLLDEVSAW